MAADPNKFAPFPDELAALRSIVEGTAYAFGDDFFRTLVRHLAEAVGTNHAFVSQFLPPSRIRTLAYWSRGKIVDNIEYELPGTPCEEVIAGGFCQHESGLQAIYEREKGIESYLGVPMKLVDGTVVGHLCVFDERPMMAEPRMLFIFQIFAARAMAELDRLRAEKMRHETEQRLQDLFDEAPIAYVNEDLQSRFIRANRTARRILGLTEEEAKGIVGMSLVPDTPDAQARVHAAFEAIQKGEDQSGVVLELRRKSDGKQIFIQWWSRPDPSGHYTRTMFLDITDRILLEQEQARLQAQNSYLREELKSIHNFSEIVGANQGLLEVLGKVERVARTDATVMITGETGTGKELVARAIHSSSPRADKPFIKLNCAALPASLVESELFGHERGAFSGAVQRRMGRFELAHGGTIFLDEIGEMPLDVQVKLLRVLQEQEFERIGGSQTIKVDVRVIAATNRDLQREIKESRFRSDLYYRLNVFPVDLPALRARRDDIPALVEHFVRKYGPRVGRRVEAVDRKSVELLANYAWPGNIRELENIVERALILGSGETLVVEPEMMGMMPAVEDAPHDPGATAPAAAGAVCQDLNGVQRGHIIATLDSTGWIIEGERGAARRLGMKPATLRHRMKKLGIERRS